MARDRDARSAGQSCRTNWMSRLILTSWRDCPSAFLERLVPIEAEVAPVDLGRRGEARPVTAPWISAAALFGDIEHDRLGDTLDREVARDLQLALAGRRDARRAKRERRKLLGIEEIRRAEVCIALIDACVDTRGLEGDLDRRAAGIGGVFVHRPIDVGEVSSNRRDHQVFDSELRAGVHGVDTPLRNRGGRRVRFLCGSHFILHV